MIFKALCVTVGGLGLLFGCGVVWGALLDATNPVNTLDGRQAAIGAGIAIAGLLAIILPFTL